MPPVLNPWLVSYVSQHYQTKSRYEIDHYLIEVGYAPQDIEAVWQSLNPSSEGSGKASQTRHSAQKWRNRLIIIVPPILVLFFMIVIIFGPILPISNSSHTKIQYNTIPIAKLSPDSKLLAINTEKLEIWNTNDQKVLRSFSVPKQSSFWWSSDSQYLAFNPTKGIIQIWRVSDRTLLNSLENPPGETSFDYATEVIFNSDKNLLIWAYSNATADPVRGRTLWQIDGQTRFLLKTLAQLDFMVSSPDKRLLAISQNVSNFQILQANNGMLIKTIGASFPQSVAFSPDNELLATGTWNGAIQIWHLSDKNLLLTLNPSKEGIGELAFSPDGQFLASTNRHPDGEVGSIANDKSIKLWRLSDGVLIKKFEGHSDIINSLTFSSDGQTLISTSRDKTLRFWPVKYKGERLGLPALLYFTRDEFITF